VTEEEQRAALWRRQNLAQAQARRDRYIALAGDRQEREALDAAWMPLLLSYLEASAVGDESEFLEELYVDVPQKDVYITEVPDDLLA